LGQIGTNEQTTVENGSYCIFKIEERDRYDGKTEEHIHYPFTVKKIEIETYIINKKIIHICPNNKNKEHRPF
jgi:hypothetical protein